MYAPILKCAKISRQIRLFNFAIIFYNFIWSYHPVRKEYVIDASFCWEGRLYRRSQPWRSARSLCALSWAWGSTTALLDAAASGRHEVYLPGRHPLLCSCNHTSSAITHESAYVPNSLTSNSSTYCFSYCSGMHRASFSIAYLWSRRVYLGRRTGGFIARRLPLYTWWPPQDIE